MRRGSTEIPLSFCKKPFFFSRLPEVTKHPLSRFPQVQCCLRCSWISKRKNKQQRMQENRRSATLNLGGNGCGRGGRVLNYFLSTGFTLPTKRRRHDNATPTKTTNDNGDDDSQQRRRRRTTPSMHDAGRRRTTATTTDKNGDGRRRRRRRQRSTDDDRRRKTTTDGDDDDRR